MSEAVRAWLPTGHLTSERVRSAVGGAVAAWSDAWFGRPLVRPSTLRAGEAGAVSRTGWIQVGGFGISLPRRSASRLLAAALDASIEQQAQTETDQQVLDHLERTILADLGGRLAQTLDGDRAGVVRPSEGGAEDIVVSLWDQDGEVAQVSLPRSALVAWVRGHARPPRPAAEPLGRRTVAMGPQDVRLEAMLGTATLSLEEFRNLAPGDVLVLDTRLDDLLTLSLAGDTLAVATARLTEADGHMALDLQT